MSLGTLDQTPPPFFRQGPSALTQLSLFAALAVFLMAADTRFAIATPLRALIATALTPVQRVLAVPVDMVHDAADYWRGLNAARELADATQARLVAQAVPAARLALLEAENARLRALAELRPALTVKSVVAEVLFEAADPFSRKVVISRGTAHGIVIASPVIDEIGVLGQVTRVFPLSAEVTLLSDKDASIPVLNTRTQQRGAAFGGAATARDGAAMELRYLASNADVQIGDVLTTSGLDGVYAAGLPVARVVGVDRLADGGFARIRLAPLANADGVRHVLVAEPLSRQLPPRPEPAADPDKSPAKRRGPR
jgi:rod shape-determining protein MreC